MSRIAILCVEDEQEVRDAVERDLKPFADVFRIETAEDVNDARAVLKECADEGDEVGLVLCDHVMPGTTGVEFLVELNNEPATEPIRKVLITGQAMQDDTIKAINEADLDHYIAKPWKAEQLHEVVRTQLTEYVLLKSDNLMPFVQVLDGARLLDAISGRRSDT